MRKLMKGEADSILEYVQELVEQLSEDETIIEIVQEKIYQQVEEDIADDSYPFCIDRHIAVKSMALRVFLGTLAVHADTYIGATDKILSGDFLEDGDYYE